LRYVSPFPEIAMLKAQDPKIQVAIYILDMFDPGIAHLIDGPGIDRPYNAISLTATTHSIFGSLEIYFDPTEEKHTYIIRSWSEAAGLIMNPALPIRRILRLDPDCAIDPPSRRLLAIHRAIGQILHLSAADWYIDDILHDREWVRVIAEDGSADLGSYVSARLGGWAEVSAVG
jgi:HNH endonuclease